MTQGDGMNEHDQLREAVLHITRLEALLAWVEGACTDELSHADILAAIGRHPKWSTTTALVVKRRAEAMCRLLVDSGDMTPMAHMQLRKLWAPEKVE